MIEEHACTHLIENSYVHARIAVVDNRLENPYWGVMVVLQHTHMSVSGAEGRGGGRATLGLG